MTTLEIWIDASLDILQENVDIMSDCWGKRILILYWPRRLHVKDIWIHLLISYRDRKRENGKMDFEKIQNLLIQHEGERLRVYRDSKGILTIGIGRNLENKGISRIESRFMLQNDISEHIFKLETNYPWFTNLDETRQCVMIDMCHQLGIGGLSLFKNFLAAMEAEDYRRASSEMLDSKWAREDSPKRARELAQMIDM